MIKVNERNRLVVLMKTNSFCDKVTRASSEKKNKQKINRHIFLFIALEWQSFCLGLYTKPLPSSLPSIGGYEDGSLSIETQG